MENVSWLDNAQLLASIGTSGNSSIPDYDHLALVAGGPIYGLEGQVLPGLAPYSKGNEDLTWGKDHYPEHHHEIGIPEQI